MTETRVDLPRLIIVDFFCLSCKVENSELDGCVFSSGTEQIKPLFNLCVRKYRRRERKYKALFCWVFFAFAQCLS